MAGTEALVLLVLVPAGALALGVVLVRSAYSELRMKDAEKAGRPSLVLVSHAVMATSLVLGLSLWAFSQSALSGLASASSPAADPVSSALLWSELTYAFTACAAVAGQIRILRERLGQFLGPGFGRVLPLYVIPVTSVVFAMTLGFLTLASLFTGAWAPINLSSGAANSIVLAYQAFCGAAALQLITLGFSNRIQDLSGRGFSRAAILADAGQVPLILALVWVFLALGAA